MGAASSPSLDRCAGASNKLLCPDDRGVLAGAMAADGGRAEAVAAVGNLANCLVKLGRPAQV